MLVEARTVRRQGSWRARRQERQQGHRRQKRTQTGWKADESRGVSVWESKLLTNACYINCCQYFVNISGRIHREERQSLPNAPNWMKSTVPKLRMTLYHSEDILEDNNNEQWRLLLLLCLFLCYLLLWTFDILYIGTALKLVHYHTVDSLYIN